jgi:LPS export ABC transporter protein LptC
MVRETQIGLIVLSRKATRFIGFSSALLASLLLVTNCVNDLETIQRVTYDPKAPEEVTKDLRVFYNDSGFARIEITASLAETYSKPEMVTKLKDGLRVNFFSTDGKIVSTLTALYGEVNLTSGKMVVKDSVQLYNFAKKQRLLTEVLYWNQRDSVIYTYSNVVVRSPAGSLYGDGIKTKQDFSNYVFLNPRGKYDFTKD